MSTAKTLGSGFGSDSTWGCNGSPAELHTNFGPNQSLGGHLTSHGRRVLAHATTLGCPNANEGDGGPCEGPWSSTTWNCNGTPETKETCSLVGTSLEQHLLDHRARVLARAAELGCS